MARNQSSSKWVESLGQTVHSLGCEAHVLLRHGSGKYKSVLSAYVLVATEMAWQSFQLPCTHGRGCTGPFHSLVSQGI